jgi:hypothetical protein
MSQVNNYVGNETISFTDRVKQNFTDHKWQVLVPGPVGLAALAGTIVFLVSNPFGWVFSAGLVGAGIAFATLNAIGAIGYSLYFLLKEPRQINNLYTHEPDGTPLADSLISALQHQFGSRLEANKLPAPAIPDKNDHKLAPAAPKKKKAKKPIPLPTPPYHEPVLPPYVEPPLPEPKAERRATNPTTSALLLGGLLLGGYALYNKFFLASALIFDMCHSWYFVPPTLPAP